MKKLMFALLAASAAAVMAEGEIESANVVGYSTVTFAAGDRYDSEKASPGTWIYALTRNAVIDYFRKSRPSEELPEDLSSDELPEDGVLKREMLEELAAALEGLPPDLTDIIVMRYYDRMPLTDIAEKLSLSYGAVKLRHQKALDMLRRVMDPGNGKILRLV